MANKDFREIQVSSTLLVVIFLGVLALGVFIFLLGVSVGKKQTAVGTPTQIVTQQIPEPVKEPPVKPAATDETAGAGQGQENPAAPKTGAPVSATPAAKTADKPVTTDKPPATKTAAETKKPAPAPSGLYYVQVAAFTDRAQAQAAADKYKRQGYTAVLANPKPGDTKTWYRLRLGGYASRDQAVNLLEKLNAAAGKKTDFRVVQD
jgi:septal ring-binding cell division protein DamX